MRAVRTIGIDNLMWMSLGYAFTPSNTV